MMRYLSLLALIFLIAAIIICATVFHKSPIEKTIDKAIDAVNTHNYTEFCRYVNTQGLIKSYIDLQERENPMNWEGQSSYFDMLNDRIQYFVETERIPNPERFKKLINPQIMGKKANVSLILELKKYSVTCTTLVNLDLKESGWQITGIDLQRIWNRLKTMEPEGRTSLDLNMIKKWQEMYGSLQPGQSEAPTPASMVLAIIYDTVRYSNRNQIKKGADKLP